jgi:acyl-CoA synthetase (NDP forming)
VHVAHQLGFPVSLKVDSPDILHKSDCGGVKLNLRSSAEVRNAFEAIIGKARAHFPEARLKGAVVSAMASPGVEVILGMNRDPQFGPVLLFGLGGVTVELFRDVSMRLLPASPQDVQEMISEIKGIPLLRGYRGATPVDEGALVEALLKLARIAEQHEDITEIDLNPVIAYQEGIVVVDARILRR